MLVLQIARVMQAAIEQAHVSQPRQNLTRQTSGAQHRDTRTSLQVSSDQASIRLASETLQMVMPDEACINEQIRS